VMSTEVNQGPMEPERRMKERRSQIDRRYAERRRPERAVSGRRALATSDRRVAERRSPQSAAVQPA
jgi:hypothetical protein